MEFQFDKNIAARAVKRGHYITISGRGIGVSKVISIKLFSQMSKEFKKDKTQQISDLSLVITTADSNYGIFRQTELLMKYKKVKNDSS